VELRRSAILFHADFEVSPLELQRDGPYFGGERRIRKNVQMPANTTLWLSRTLEAQEMENDVGKMMAIPFMILQALQFLPR